MAVSYFFHLFVFYIVFTLPLSPLLKAAFYLSERFEALSGPGLAAHALSWVVASVFLLLAPFLAHTAALARACHNYSFADAVALAIWKLRLYLSYLPVIGRVFTPPPARPSDDEQPPPVPGDNP